MGKVRGENPVSITIWSGNSAPSR